MASVMSITEFLDGLPPYEERNFSNFNSKKCEDKPPPVYIKTIDTPTEQNIFNEKSHLLLKCVHKQWDIKDISIDKIFKRIDVKKGRWLKRVKDLTQHLENMQE